MVSESESKITAMAVETGVRTVRNQLIIRSADIAGKALIASGLRMLGEEGRLYTVTRTKVAARRNPQGKVIVGEHEQRTFERTRTDRGRNYATEKTTMRVKKAGARRVVAGKTLPILAYGYIGYDVLKGNYDTSGPAYQRMYGVGEAQFLIENPHVIREELNTQRSMVKQTVRDVAMAIQVASMIGGAVFG